MEQHIYELLRFLMLCNRIILEGADVSYCTIFCYISEICGVWVTLDISQIDRLGDFFPHLLTMEVEAWNRRC